MPWQPLAEWGPIDSDLDELSPPLPSCLISGRKARASERDKERMQTIVATFMPAAKGSTRTPLGPKTVLEMA